MPSSPGIERTPVGTDRMNIVNENGDDAAVQAPAAGHARTTSAWLPVVNAGSVSLYVVMFGGGVAVANTFPTSANAPVSRARL